MKRYSSRVNYRYAFYFLLAAFCGGISWAGAPTKTNRAFTCIMHVHTRMSSGLYSLAELTAIAQTQGVDVIFLSDNLRTSIEFGLPPWRHIFRVSHQEKPSVAAFGAERYLAEVQRENERQSLLQRGQPRDPSDPSDPPDLLYIPGVEIIPRFFWSGSLFKTNLVCHNHQRNLIVLGTFDARFLANLPVTGGFRWGRDSGWIILTRALLVLFLGCGLAFIFLPRRLARRSDPGYYPGLSGGTPLGCAESGPDVHRGNIIAQGGNPGLSGGAPSGCAGRDANGVPYYSPGGNPGLYTVREIRRAFFFGLILPLIVLISAVNLVAAFLPEFDIYSPDNPRRFEQRVINSLKQEGLLHFWAHPEAADHQQFSFWGVPFAVDTRPYPEVLLHTEGYTGFAGVNEGENKFVDPGSIWDQVLLQYLAGQRTEPVWCFGEMIYRAETRDEKLSNIETVIFSPEKKAAPLLVALKSGSFYARSNWQGQKFTLEQWQVAGLESGQSALATNAVDIALRVSAQIPGEKAEVLIVRNGEVIRKENLSLPLELNFSDRPPAFPAYYRTIVSGKYPVRLVTNPIFVRRAR